MAKERKGSNIKCKACEQEFYVPFYRIETAKFCSLKCQNHIQYEKFKYKCKLCGKDCEASPCRRGVTKFCSIECYNISQVKLKSCEKEKRRLAIKSAREKGELSTCSAPTRKFAFLLKEEKCQVCGYNEFKTCLDVHHIDRNPNNNSIENLAILCCICHRKVHRNIINLGNDISKIPNRYFPRKNQKLFPEDVIKIKELLRETKLSHSKIAEKFGIKRESVTKINRGVRWSRDLTSN